MGMTQTQKILAAHAGLAEVKAGQLINAKLDIVLGNDITTPVAINEFEKAGFDGVFDKEHIAIVLDHFVPNKDIKSATQSKQCREFANKYDILNFYDVGQMGIEHAPLAIKTAGISVVIAKSFARIFYRNSINIGLPIMECPEAVDAIGAGDTVSVNFDTGVITDETTGKTFQAEPFPPFIQKIIADGGLMKSLTKK